MDNDTEIIRDFPHLSVRYFEYAAAVRTLKELIQRKGLVMPKPEYEFHLPSAPWIADTGNVYGIWRQALASDPGTGAYTGLIRYAAGTDTSANGVACHEYWEEIYVLDGDLTDLRLNQAFSRGMYACRPPGMLHGPWLSESGVLMLEIRYPANNAGAPSMER
jgi:hypothetical protein